MGNFLGFTFYYEQSQTGWNGTAFNQTTKIELSNVQTLQLLKDELKLGVLMAHCQNDMGASYIIDCGVSEKIVYRNLPCQELLIGMLEIDYGVSGTVIADGRFDGKDAQYRVKVECFGRYSLCKVLGIFVEPNLLAIN